MRDESTEQWLRDENTPFLYLENVPWERFDIKASRQNQARIFVKGGLIEERVAEYAAAMENGRQFPAVIAYEGRHGYILIAGNHRQAAAERAKRPTTDVYLVTSQDTKLLNTLTRAENNRNGVRPEMDERLAQAKYHLTTYGDSIKETARQFNLTAGQLSNALRADQCQERLLSLGLSLPTPRHQRDAKHLSWLYARLDSIISDPVLKEVATLTFEADLSTVLVDELLAIIKKGRSEQAQIALVAEFRSRPDVSDTLHRKQRHQPNPRAKPSSQSLILGRLSSLHTLLQRADTFAALGFHTAEERQQLQATLTKVLKRLEALRANEPSLPVKPA